MSYESSIMFTTYFSCILIVFELFVRYLLLPSVFMNPSIYWPVPLLMIIPAYLLCLLANYYKDSLPKIIHSEAFKFLFGILHLLDGLGAFIIGISIYYRNEMLLLIGILMVSKCLFIFLFNRMINGISRNSSLIKLNDIHKTTKSFLHHFSSYLFIAHPYEILLTTTWRSISMSGHATLYFRGKFTDETLKNVQYLLSVVRVLFILFLFYNIFSHYEIRKAFGESAFGHVGYMATRLSPIYALGGPNFAKNENEEWQKRDFYGKMLYLYQQKHLIFAIELFSLFYGIIYLIYLRFYFLSFEVRNRM